AAGCTTSSSGTVATAGQVITVSALTLAAGATVDITYGATSGGACTATGVVAAPATLGATTWTTQQQSTTSGTLTNIGTSPSVTVNAADGLGSMVLTSVNGQTTTNVPASSAD